MCRAGGAERGRESDDWCQGSTGMCSNHVL
jgi:hypothetical protein